MRLDGWKKIAGHLGCSVEEARGFRQIKIPVRKLLNGRVWTTTEALRLWQWGAAEVCEELHAARGRAPDEILH